MNREHDHLHVMKDGKRIAYCKLTRDERQAAISNIIKNRLNKPNGADRIVNENTCERCAQSILSFWGGVAQ